MGGWTAPEGLRGAAGPTLGRGRAPGARPRAAPRSQPRRGGSAGRSLLPLPGRAPHARAHQPAHAHAGGRSGLGGAQASLADIFLWEDCKRAVNARNYTGYKLRHPWPAQARSPPWIRLGEGPGTLQRTKHTPSNGAGTWGEGGCRRGRPKFHAPPDLGSLAELGWPALSRVEFGVSGHRPPEAGSSPGKDVTGAAGCPGPGQGAP